MSRRGSSHYVRMAQCRLQPMLISQTQHRKLVVDGAKISPLFKSGRSWHCHDATWIEASVEPCRQRGQDQPRSPHAK